MKMKIDKIKKITSELEKIDFSIRFETNSELSYANMEDTIYIDFNITKRCPPTLFSELIRLIQEKGIGREPPALRLMSYKLKLGDGCVHINPEMFNFGKKVESAYFFNNQQELLCAAEKLVRLTIDDVLPCLKDVLENAVFCTTRMHERLSADPKGIAQSFAETYHLPETSLEESVALARAFLDPIIPLDITKRGKVFHENEDLMVGLAAYLGEAVIRELPGYWDWLYNVPLPRQYDEVKKDVFVVASSQFEQSYYCPFYNIESHWTFYKKVSALGFDHFIPPW